MRVEQNLRLGGISPAARAGHDAMLAEVFQKLPKLGERRHQRAGLMSGAEQQMLALGRGLMAPLDRLDVRTDRMIFRTRGGQDVWDARRGLKIGHAVPQITAHRADIQQLMLDAVAARMPAGTLTLDAACETVEDTGAGVRVTFRRSDGSTLVEEGEVLIGADGTHSAVRRYLNPTEGPPRWSGLLLWRGSVDWPVVRDGHTILNSGGINRKFIFCPIGPGKTPGTQLMNWACVVRQAPPGIPAPGREDWTAKPGPRCCTLSCAISRAGNRYPRAGGRYPGVLGLSHVRPRPARKLDPGARDADGRCRAPDVSLWRQVIGPGHSGRPHAGPGLRGGGRPGGAAGL